MPIEPPLAALRQNMSYLLNQPRNFQVICFVYPYLLLGKFFSILS